MIGRFVTRVLLRQRVEQETPCCIILQFFDVLIHAGSLAGRSKKKNEWLQIYFYDYRSMQAK